MKKIQNALLYLLFFSTIFEYWALFEGISPVRITGTLYIIFVILMPKGFFTLSRQFKSFYIPLVLFFVFLCIMSILNINEVSSHWFDRKIFMWSFLMMLFVNHERMRPLSLTRAFMALSLGSLLLSILAHLDIETTYIDGRLTIFGLDQNYIGMRMALSTVVFIYYAIKNPLRQGSYRYFALLFAIPMVSLLIRTGSRVAILVLFAMFLVIIFTIRTRNIIIKLGYVFLVALIAGVVIHYTLSSELMTSRLQSTIETGHMSGRQNIWIKIMPLISENPIVGVGSSGYAKYSMEVFGKQMSPHNALLELMSLTGIVGTAIFLFFIGMLVRGAIITFKRARNALPLILILYLFAIIASLSILHGTIEWCLFAYIISSYLNTVETKSAVRSRKIQLST